ncbi:hypothetical protein Ahy_B06g084519 isoform A [Arachis hypogaea]|uniref:Uncharacterized protein n=1 Tax=Arachis hypogaea TaxID=3818 RepID=A0A444YS41_ARAHY|nr:hypothetical protein Ahy_B06g084519 isoform A [Arachis hypogaea]
MRHPAPPREARKRQQIITKNALFILSVGKIRIEAFPNDENHDPSPKQTAPPPLSLFFSCPSCPHKPSQHHRLLHLLQLQTLIPNMDSQILFPLPQFPLSLRNSTTTTATSMHLSDPFESLIPNLPATIQVHQLKLQKIIVDLPKSR